MCVASESEASGRTRVEKNPNHCKYCMYTIFENMQTHTHTRSIHSLTQNCYSNKQMLVDLGRETKKRWFVRVFVCVFCVPVSFAAWRIYKMLIQVIW